MRLEQQEIKSSISDHFRRLVIAGTNLLTPLHTGVLVVYYMLRWFGRTEWWFVDALGYVLPWLFGPLVVLLPAALLRRSRGLLVLSAVSVVFFMFTYGHLYYPWRSVRDSEPTLVVMTYNVHIRNSDVAQIATAIREHAPDIVGLHELGATVAQALEGRLAKEYPYRRIEPGCCGILSRYPFLDYQTFQLGEDRAQRGSLDLGDCRIEVFNVHLQMPVEIKTGPLGLPSTEYHSRLRDANVWDLLSRLAAVDLPVIVIGDFNLTDQHSAYAVLTQHLSDAHRESGWGMGFTARFLPLGLPTWRIDYVFHSPQLVALRTVLGDYGSSDHRPVIAELISCASENQLGHLGSN